MERILGVRITDFQLTELTFQKSFRDAVGNAAVEKAKVEAQEQMKRQDEVAAQRSQIRALGDANAAREQAKGQADARLVLAQTEAKAIQLKGEAEALAIRAQNEALGNNPRLVELRKAERWDGQLPKQMLGQVVPFMNVDQSGVLGK